MMFVPSGFTVPPNSFTHDFTLEPLRVAHVDLDFYAVMSSRTMLRVWSQSVWPSEEFSREDNLKDLIRHETEHNDRIAFTYTVLNPTRTECLGCVYIVPIPESAGLSSEDHCAALVRFWVKESRIEDDLDRLLLDRLVSWLRDDWPFERVYFHCAPQDRRQQAIFVEVGLKRGPDIELPDRPGTWWTYAV